MRYLGSILIAAASCWFLLGCERNRGDLNLSINGEPVNIEVKDTHMKIYNDEQLIVEITLVSNAYHVTTYADGNISLIAQYNKWDAVPKLVNRMVSRGGTEYLLVYNRDGKVSEETAIGIRPK